MTVSLVALVLYAPNAAAASRTWTTDTDFNESGAIFLSTEVVGTGVAAKVELIKSTTDWANKNPSGPTPADLEFPSMAFDPVGGVTVLFGGYNGGFPNAYSDKTWEYDFPTNTWTDVSGSPRPPGREAAGISYDPVEQVMALHGGYNDTEFLTDTWEYDVQTNVWTEITTSPSPPPMVDGPLAYHASASRHVTIGQSLSSGNLETWAYDATGDTWVNRAPSGMPSVRAGFALAYQAARDRTVLFGGSFFMTLYDQTYEYNYASNAWQLISVAGPSARAGHAMMYNPTRSSVYLFGGLTGSGAAQDTWRYYEGPGGPTWESVSTTTHPPARRYAGFTFDSTNNVAVLYGGLDGAGSRLADTWTLGAAYAAAGKYTSAVYDAGGASVNWNALWWNKTLQPAQTFLRFQLAASTSVSGPFNFVGPAGTASSYYTTPGTAVYAGHDGQRFLKFLGDFGSFDTQSTPSMEDVTLTFDVPPADPCIVSTSPADLTFNVPQTQDVVITFSESMNRSSLVVTFLRGTPVTFTRNWAFSDSVVTLTHASEPFAENMVYQLQVAATDLQDRPLAATCPGGAPAAANPFTFVTEKIYPTIQKTTPPFDYNGYNVTRPIYVEFSEGMNPASVSWTSTPGATFTSILTNGDRNLTLTPSGALSQCTRYEMQINGTDKAGLALIPGAVPNPWHWYTECKNPYLTSTSPIDLQMDVALNAPIILDFVEPMLTTSVVITTFPTIGGPTLTWTMGNRRATITHVQTFPTCQVYTVTVTGTDVDGNPLIQNPVNPGVRNPFKFMTLCDNPSIMLTVPTDREVDVPQNQEILVAFSDPMNEASVQWTIAPPVIELNPTWDASVLLHLLHTGFRQCTTYTVRVTQGSSQTGFPLVQGFAPNPWTFDTICEAPYVTDTNPANDSALIPVDAPIWVNFSEPMDTTTVIAILVPPDVTFTRTWSNGDMTLRLDHATPFVDCTQYDIVVDGVGMDGNGLLTGDFTPGAPNPWTFATICIVPFPYIIRTDPANLQPNVPLTKSIVVDFSEAIDRTTFQVTISPTVGLTPQWTNGDTRVTLVHTTDFLECRTHTVTISAWDIDGNGLGNVTGSKPNPWTFKTTCIPPQIILTDPADGATGVPLDKSIVVTFSEAMNPTSVTWSINPTITLTPSWNSPTNTILTLSHLTGFQANTQYCIQVAGQDVDGAALVPGPVPNPWCFTTGQGLPDPQGLQVRRLPPNDIELRWRTVTGAAGYRIYSATNRFNPFPAGWAMIGDIPAPSTSFFAVGHLTDGLTRYYIVRARDASGSEGSNSTMGSKVPLGFSFSTLRSNTYWISLPYRSIYRQASDISNELTAANIDVIAKWNPATQSSILWYFFRGAWRGTNFAINPGDGLYIGVRAAFSWVINGTDGDVSLSFTAYPAPNPNVHWISLPHTSSYQRASDIVRAIEGGTGPTANTKIIEVVKWDGASQSYFRFFWSPTGWTGTDFAIASGEGIYLKVVVTFTWNPGLLTPEVP